MVKRLIAAAAFLCIAIGPAVAAPVRIVSLAPSITEVLFALGAGDRVVGATEYCIYPEAARAVPRVGGYLDLNYETIIAARPDLVIALAEHDTIAKSLRKLKIPVVVVNHQRFDVVAESFRVIGDAVSAADEAAGMIVAAEKKLAAFKVNYAAETAPSTLICVNALSDASARRTLYIAGSDGFYDDMLRHVGGTNCYKGKVRYPIIGPEGLFLLNPDIVIVMMNGRDQDAVDAEGKAWAAFSSLNAVKNGRIHIINDSAAVIPGPRLFDFVADLATIIHAP